MPAAMTDGQWLERRCLRLSCGCVVFLGKLDKDGYGAIHRAGPLGRYHLAHRLAYAMAHGAIPNSLELDHKCRIRCCVNPDHLEAVTHITNVRRGEHPRETHRNGRKTHCLRGHPLAGQNLLIEGGVRKCRLCRRTLQAASRSAKRTRET